MRSTAVVLLALLLAGCLEGGEGPAPGSGETPTTTAPTVATPTPTANELALRTLAEGSSSGHGNESRAIRDAVEWRTFWTKHASREVPPPDAPAVDFATEMVLARVLAEKGSGCWAVRIENATASDGRIVVDVVVSTPPPQTVCTAQLTQPFHFVALARTEGEVEWRERDVVGPPPGNE